MKKSLIVLFVLIGGMGLVMARFGPENEPVPIPPSPQRSGNAKNGLNYIIEGDYVKSGLPLSLYRLAFGKAKTNYLGRDSINANVRYDFNVVKAANGEDIVVPNCFQCHAQIFNDSLILGLGNSTADFTKDQKLNSKAFEKIGLTYLKLHKKKYEAAKEFIDVGLSIGDQLFTAVRGTNPADRLAALLISHRDPNTLQWNDSASIPVPDEVIPTDVPAWWMLKKKNAMFFNGFGRGDFGRFLMGSILLTVSDTLHANRVDGHMNDVLSYIYSIEPPKYPYTIDNALAEQGRITFEEKCSKCHGTYGESGQYPNLLIPQSIIGTDSMLNRSNYQYSDMINWFNNSWFNKGDHPARLVPFNGYVAPPLDGVWITAPYFHNGSVPTIEAVLNSYERPEYWTRNFDKTEYDYDKLGWKYKQVDHGGDKNIYDTHLPGYNNTGHYFGDRLTTKERKAVIEYLKTL
ncbi:MAG: hypothetical protein C5B52_16435 [Bacteroidetes bacterium]|nr:MAG: hypothetical protein C5B52_16435 [Bacteroidota bacterium]